MLEILRAAQTPLPVTEVAARVGLHPNTVRWHLDQLTAAGRITRTPEARDHPGRPRLLYATRVKAAFQPRSRRPKTPPIALPDATVELIVELRKDLVGQGWTPGRTPSPGIWPITTDDVYVWSDGIHLRIRPREAKSCVLLLMGVRADGTKELIAMSDGCSVTRCSTRVDYFSPMSHE